MIESNYSTLKYSKPGRTETQKRAAALDHAIQQLNQYRIKASKKKQPIIDNLIVAYSEMIESIQKKLGE